MKRSQRRRNSRPVQQLKKLVVSGAMLATFAVYAVHERLVGNDVFNPTEIAPENVATTVPPQTTNHQAAAPQASPTPWQFQQAASPVPPQPTATTPPKAVISQNKFRDGQFTGPTVNAYYGLVQVEVTIQNGNVNDIQFLQYPNHARTSQRINSIAMPYLVQEAIQAQSPRIRIISGATLTSEAFARSLQIALSQAATGA